MDRAALRQFMDKAKQPTRFQMEVGARLRALRVQKTGVSPEDLPAWAMDNGKREPKPSTVRDMERGVNTGIESLKVLLELYDTSLGEFFAYTIDDEAVRDMLTFRKAMKVPHLRQILRGVLDAYKEVESGQSR